MRLLKVCVVIATAAAITPQTLAAQSCVAGPLCSAAGSRYKSYTTKMTTRLNNSSGTANAATLNYCVMMFGAEVSRACADEQRASGKNNCADLADQQKQAFLQNAKTSEKIVKMTSQGSFHQICGF